MDGIPRKHFGLYSIFVLCKEIYELFSSGPANDWTEWISPCIRYSRKAREYVAEEVLFKHENRFREYLIDCTSAEVKD